MATLTHRKPEATGIPILSTLMKVQTAVFLVYGVTFFFVPAWTLETIFAFETLPPIAWPRAMGAVFLAVALAEYLCIRHLGERLDEVSVYAAVPGLILVGIVWDRLAETYEGSDLFFWVTIAVTAFFLITVGAARLNVRET